MKPPSNGPNNLTDEIVNTMSLSMQDTFKSVSPIILKNAGNTSSRSKADGSPVTDTDILVEQTIIKKFSEQSPGIAVFGEEGGYENNLPQTYWLIDPIDGTSNFIKNVPTFTSMAVLISGQDIISAIIYNPSTDEMFTAQKGKGAYKNNQKLSLATTDLPNNALCKHEHIDPINKILKPKHIECEVAPAGGGHGFTMVVDGKAAARFQLHSRGHIHDYAPGALLVSEAGGAVIPIKCNVYTYECRSFIVCHPQIKDILAKNIEAIQLLEN